jgi:hypothetical protein
MRPGLFIHRSGTIAPANLRTKEAFREFGLKEGQLVTAQVMRARNPKLNALVQVVLTQLADAFGVTTETVKARLKIALGYADFVEKPDGSIEPKPHSFNFEDMADEDEFREFWRACEAAICANLLPELPGDDAQAILAILNGGSNGKRRRV